MDFTNKKIAIAGFGKEGKSVLEYLRRNDVPDKSITVFDQKQNDSIPSIVAQKTGADVFADMYGFDIVFRSPSIRPDAISTDGKVWSLTREFFAKCPAPIIGVTGTNGKGTTCALLTHILQNAGHTVHLVGNIGVPALDILEKITEDDIVVYELSSFQLWDMQVSPHIAGVLMITEDHLDKHTDMAEYVAAKAVIASHQNSGDIIVYHGENDHSTAIANSSAGTKRQYMTEHGAHTEDNSVIIDEQIICSADEIGLSGIHNRENVCAAVTLAWNITKDAEAIRKAISDFKGLPHRMEFVRSFEEVDYYNDSNSSVAVATEAALESFAGRPRVLIFGGYDKGLDVSPALRSLTQNDHVVLIGQTGGNFEAMLTDQQVPFTNIGSDITMEQIVQTARQCAKPGSVVILSPAHPSYDMFDNLYQRGDEFRDEVNNLSN